MQHALTGSEGEGWGLLAVQKVILGVKSPLVCQPGLGLVYWRNANQLEITPVAGTPAPCWSDGAPTSWPAVYFNGQQSDDPCCPPLQPTPSYLIAVLCNCLMFEEPWIRCRGGGSLEKIVNVLHWSRLCSAHEKKLNVSGDEN